MGGEVAHGRAPAGTLRAQYRQPGALARSPNGFDAYRLNPAMASVGLGCSTGGLGGLPLDRAEAF